MPDRPQFKWEWNINTVAVLVGFSAGFVAWGYTLADMKTGREVNAQNILVLQTSQASLATRVDLIEKSAAVQANFEYRLAQFEKALDNLDLRVSRINESYGNQFADMRNQLSSISTQIALTNQTLNRIEATRGAVPQAQGG